VKSKKTVRGGEVNARGDLQKRRGQRATGGTLRSTKGGAGGSFVDDGEETAGQTRCGSCARRCGKITSRKGVVK